MRGYLFVLLTKTNCCCWKPNRCDINPSTGQILHPAFFLLLSSGLHITVKEKQQRHAANRMSAGNWPCTKCSSTTFSTSFALFRRAFNSQGSTLTIQQKMYFNFKISNVEAAEEEAVKRTFIPMKMSQFITETWICSSLQLLPCSCNGLWGWTC